jgi:predicted nuclease with TOPRIM domain
MVNRDKQADVLRRTQAKRKEQKKEQVLKAIQEILAQKKPLTFANIANVSGCSISYLYKWDDIKAYIHELQQQKETQLNSLEEKESRPHSLKTLHEVARQRISKLEEEIKELKGQNEKLRGHVAEIYELRDECERLRTQLRELTNPNPSSKVIPIKAVAKEISQVDNSQQESKPKVEEPPSVAELFELINSMEIKVNSKLKQEIARHELSTVKLSIEAFQQYRSKTHVDNPEGCLLSMIRDEAEPNGQDHPETSKPKSSTNQQSVNPTKEGQKKLVSANKLKQLSNIFGKKND